MYPRALHLTERSFDECKQILEYCACYWNTTICPCSKNEINRNIIFVHQRIICTFLYTIIHTIICHTIALPVSFFLSDPYLTGHTCSMAWPASASLCDLVLCFSKRILPMKAEVHEQGCRVFQRIFSTKQAYRIDLKDGR